MHEWIQQLEPLKRFIKGSRAEAITFILGAGASLSSGGPTTARVETELLNLKYFENPSELRSKLHELTESVTTTAIRPLFDSFTPYLGYRAMAALAHQHRILVLNLNWDRGVQLACDSLKICCESIDINEVGKIRSALDNPAVRVICVHLHGSLENEELRYGILQTLRFDGAQQKKLLLRDFLRHPTIIIGATLRGDTDMVDLLQDIERRPRRRRNRNENPVWLLTRDLSVYEDSSIGRMLSARGSARNAIYDPNLDFDRALIWINAQLRGFSFETFIEENRSLEIRDFSEIVLPRPEILRPHLNKNTIVLLGEPRLGKTTIAQFLAFFFHSLRPDPRKLDPVTKAAVRPHSAAEPGSCAGMLANAKPDDVILLEDPFGATKRPEANPKFLSALRAGRVSGQTLVTSRESTWNAGGNQTPHKVLPAEIIDPLPLPPTIGVISDHVPWYAEEDLLLLVPPDMPHLRQRIVPGDLNTPARVIDAIKQSDFTADRTREVVQEKVTMLRQRGLNVQRVLALLRLQKMSSHARSWGRILDDAAIIRPDSLAHALESHVYRFELDGQVYARLRHITDVEAVDELLAEEGSALLADLEKVAERVKWVKNSLRIRAAIRDFQSGQPGDYQRAVQRLTTEELHEWAPMLLAVAPNAGALKMLDRQMDTWALRDYVYEVVRLWPNLRSDNSARAYLRDLLADGDRQGIYAVMEAALYLVMLTDEEIWARLENALWTLYESVGKNRQHLALAFDAMFWRDAPSQRLHTTEWVRRLLDGVPPNDPLFGALVFSLVFHSNAADVYLGGNGAATRRTLDLLRSLSAAQMDEFCWMLRWHFIHECRDRALMQRRDQLPDEFQRYLQRTTFDSAARPSDRAILETACQQLRDLGEPGAAILLALNLSAIRGDFGMGRLLGDLLDNARPADRYVIAAVMTYDLPSALIDDARAYFDRPDNREALLDAFSLGLVLDGVRVEWPRFDACRDGFKVMDALHIRWPELSALNAPLQDRADFVRWVKRWAGSFSGDADDFRHLVKRLGSGDLRPLVAATTQVDLLSDPETYTARVMTRAAEIVHGESESAGFASLADLDQTGARLRNAIAEGHRLKVKGAIADILSFPQETPAQQRLRASALLTQARSLLNDDRNPGKALESAREARRLLKDLGDPISIDDESVHRYALLETIFRSVTKSDRQKLMRDSIDVLERVAAMMARNEVPLPKYSWNAAARKAFHRLVSAARQAVTDEPAPSTEQKTVPPRQRNASAETRESRPPRASSAGIPARAIDALAEKYLSGVPTPPTLLEALSPRLRIKAIQEVAAIADSGGLRRENDEWRIVVLNTDSPLRKRFTIAHELAHVIAKDERIELSLSKDQLERFCNSLAAGLLMPRARFQAALGDPVTLRNLREAAKTFAVSLHAAAIRTEEITGCPSFHVNEGRVDWTTRNVPPRLPLLRDIVRRILEGSQEIEPIFMTTKSHGGFWTVEFERESDTTCTVFLRPKPIRTTTDYRMALVE